MVFPLFLTGGNQSARPAVAAPAAPAGENLPTAADHARILLLLTLGLVLLGAVCRLVRYLLAPPLWCDEVFVSLNFVNGDYLHLTGPLQFSQVAPVLFLWAEMAAYQLLGSSEWALRLVPLLAGLAALPLFWHLARTTLPPLAATLATGVLAVARWPMAMSNLAKPYSLDLLLSLALITLAVHWLRQPGRLRYLVLLVLLGPVALFASYPVVFVAGSVSLLLLREAYRGGWRARALYLAYNLAIGAAFLGGYQIGQAQLGADNGAARAYYQECWQEGFMPTTSPAALGRWLLATHTGELMSYPAGDRNGVSTLTLLLFLAGALWCAKNRPRLLILCLLPFGLSLAASALRRYPYGAEPRLEQHLAPFICLLVGAGGTALIERVARTASGRLRWACVACALLAACGVAVSFMGTSKPSYWEREALWSWKVANELRTQASGGDQVVVLEPPEQVLPTLRWQLLHLGNRVHWSGQADWQGLVGSDNRLWLVSTRSGPGRPYAHGLTLAGGTESPLWSPYGSQGPARPVRSELDECLDRGGENWAPADHVTYTLQGSDCDTHPVRCDVFLCWPKGQTNTRPRYLLSCWPR
jgi:Dolichyl-phosphate-mannose-protein mannosyltransferase